MSAMMIFATPPGFEAVMKSIETLEGTVNLAKWSISSPQKTLMQLSCCWRLLVWQTSGKKPIAGQMAA
ncbi:hypothetical protein ATO67_20615 [Agrobacterium bohemicum]|uniref:Uncharacterized protein n=1 Tax=Agrobacterium bohemicum TaxID=2052828 RepID=A0A135P6U7_9HYPH|nr:hypothetical protein ATO67_20615 [Agrobacterium bohemicum]